MNQSKIDPSAKQEIETAVRDARSRLDSQLTQASKRLSENRREEPQSQQQQDQKGPDEDVIDAEYKEVG